MRLDVQQVAHIVEVLLADTVRGLLVRRPVRYLPRPAPAQQVTGGIVDVDQDVEVRQLVRPRIHPQVPGWVANRLDIHRPAPERGVR